MRTTERKHQFGRVTLLYNQIGFRLRIYFKFNSTKWDQTAVNWGYQLNSFKRSSLPQFQVLSVFLCPVVFTVPWHSYFQSRAVLSPFWAVATKGSMTYAFTVHTYCMGDFLLLFLLPIPARGNKIKGFGNGEINGQKNHRKKNIDNITLLVVLKSNFQSPQHCFLSFNPKHHVL